MSDQVLHLDFISFNPDVGEAQRTQLAQAASDLGQLDSVLAAAMLEAEAGSDFDVAFWFVLPQFADLEPFGTNPVYTRFLQGNVAPLLRSFAGADIKLQEDYRAFAGPAACLALIAPEETYDFEVREALEAWTGFSGRSSIGLAIGEKQVYRGAALAAGDGSALKERPETATLHATLLHGTAQSLL